MTNRTRCTIVRIVACSLFHATRVSAQEFGGVVDAPIHDIQGRAHVSPLQGEAVRTSGIVTALEPRGFYLQDGAGDDDSATSEGIFVFTSTPPAVGVGHAIEVTGIVSEFRPGSTGLTVTQLTSPQITVRSTGNALPDPVIIGRGGRQPPGSIYNDDSQTTINIETSAQTDFEPDVDGVDFYESLEGMRVRVDDPVAIGPTRVFGSGSPGNVEIYVVGDRGATASPRSIRGGLYVGADDFNPERIILNNRLQPLPIVDTGDSLPGTVVGVMSYNFGKFLFLPTQPLPAPVSGLLERETTLLRGDVSTLTIATFNVLNLDANDLDGDADISDGRFERIARIITRHLHSPDIVGLQEIQDNSGAVDDGTVAADAPYRQLINAIAVDSGPAYHVRQIDPIDGADGGQAGANIRVGLLFRPDRVSFVDRGSGGPLDATAVVLGHDGPVLSVSPGRIDPIHSAFSGTRKPLAGEFLFGDERVFVVVNHFHARTLDEPLFGFNQPPTLSSEVLRRQAAVVVHDFVAQITALDSQANVVVIGDLNDFNFSAALGVLKGDLLVNPAERVDSAERYSFVFEGNSQLMDHILVTKNAPLNVTCQIDIVHLCAEFVDRVSDHDPVLAAITFDGTPCAGDLNNDRTVELTDYESFVRCLDGPGALPRSGCERADSDLDGDADLLDFHRLQLYFGGACPEPPPAAP